MRIRSSPGAAVAAMVGGMTRRSARAARRARGARTAGWAGLQERPSTPKHQPRRLDAAAEGEILSGAGPVTLGRCWGAPPRPWARCCGGYSRRPRAPRPPVVMSAPSRGSTSTPRSWAAWPSSPATALAGSTCTWSTTRGWPPEVRPSDRQGDALAFLERARAWFRAQGMEAVMTDNGPAYRSHAWRQHCAAHDLRAALHAPHQWQGGTSRSCCTGPMPSLPVERPPHAGSAGCGGITVGAPTARGRPPARQPSHTSVGTARSPHRQACSRRRCSRDCMSRRPSATTST